MLNNTVFCSQPKILLHKQLKYLSFTDIKKVCSLNKECRRKTCLDDYFWQQWLELNFKEVLIWIPDDLRLPDFMGYGIVKNEIVINNRKFNNIFGYCVNAKYIRLLDFNHIMYECYRSGKVYKTFNVKFMSTSEYLTLDGTLYTGTDDIIDTNVSVFNDYYDKSLYLKGTNLCENGKVLYKNVKSIVYSSVFFSYTLYLDIYGNIMCNNTKLLSGIDEVAALTKKEPIFLIDGDVYKYDMHALKNNQISRTKLASNIKYIGNFPYFYLDDVTLFIDKQDNKFICISMNNDVTFIIDKQYNNFICKSHPTLNPLNLFTDKLNIEIIPLNAEDFKKLFIDLNIPKF